MCFSSHFQRLPSFFDVNTYSRGTDNQMAFTNKDLALAVIDFLETAVKDKQISEDYVDSMDVAIECVADAFGVDKANAASIKSKMGGQPLLDFINKAGLGASDTPAAPVSVLTPSTTAVDDDTRTKADALKIEGNKAMSARDFDTAVAKYSAAIDLDPSNVVYLLNRAAAYSLLGKHSDAIADAEKAIELDAGFSKAYSRLGLAKYASGDAQGAMEAYERGLKTEGDAKLDAMAKGYETAKKRVAEELEKLLDTLAPASGSSERSAPGAGAGAGGMPDFSSMFGGGAGGGMPSLADMMLNPQVMQAAQEMMLNPAALQNLMLNPAVRQMALNFGLGGGEGGAPDLSNLMNNPMLQQFMGGMGGAGGAGAGANDEEKK